MTIRLRFSRLATESYSMLGKEVVGEGEKALGGNGLGPCETSFRGEYDSSSVGAGFFALISLLSCQQAFMDTEVRQACKAHSFWEM